MTADEFSRVILDILVVLIAAKIGGEIAERLRQPAVLGELILGVVVGPSVLGWIRPAAVLDALAQLGAILLLVEVGLETDLAGVLRVGKSALKVSSVGLVLSFGLGLAITTAFGYATLAAVFLAAALTATSVGITARLLSDMGKLDTEEGRTILGAAVADDIMSLVVLAVVSGLIAGSVSVASVVRIILASAAFLLITLLAGVRASPPLFRWITKRFRVRGILVTAAFVFCLVLSYLAHVFGLAPIIGALGAGIVLAKTDEHQQIRERLSPLADIFIPIFFLSMGVLIDVSKLAQPSVLAFAGAFALAAIVGKAGAGLGAPSSMARTAIGVGMLPRGEVSLIFASFGLTRHVISGDAYSALLLVVVITTIITPILARPLFSRLHPVRGREPGKLVLPRRMIGDIVLGPRW